MAVMYAPDTDTRESGRDPIDELLALRESLDFGKCKDEILEGRLIVSPLPVLWHERACQWLYEELRETARAKGWFLSRGAEIELPPTRDRIQPDLTVITDSDQLPMLENLIPVSHVLLVAEVISPSGVREDREVKPRACAAAGVPFYFLVDRLTSPATVTLHASPGKDEYAETHSVPVGAKLVLPEPFALTLDTSALPLPR
jgi:Uma2 family endonuclease